MIELNFEAPALAAVQKEVLSDTVERCAILFAQEVRRGSRIRLLVTDVDFPVVSDYGHQSSVEAVLTPHYVAKVVKKARLQDQSLIFVHSHTGRVPAAFSALDDEGERKLAGFLAHRHPARTHAALVVARDGIASRVLGTEEEISIVSLGSKRIVHSGKYSAADVQKQHDRQVRAFGTDGQRQIQQLRVGIVGLGGTGSVLAQQLTHLGTKSFLLIDPDTLEISNLNRVVGSRPDDIGQAKVDIAKRSITSIAPETSVVSIVGDVTRSTVARFLEDVDFIFMCTDSHGSRSVAQQIAYQYRIPAIDVGTVIVARKGILQSIFARVQLLSTTEGCLWCSNLLNAEEIRREMMSDEERRLDPYLRGAREPAPAVISLNSTAVSLAVTMFLGVVTAAPIEGRYLLYNAQTSVMRSVSAPAQAECFICSSSGIRGKGDTHPLFARPE